MLSLHGVNFIGYLHVVLYCIAPDKIKVIAMYKMGIQMNILSYF